MNRFHCILFVVLLFFASSALASGSKSVAATSLSHGYFDITNLSNDWGFSISRSTSDSMDGIYLFVESGWDGPCCMSPYYTRFSIGKNLSSQQIDSIWVLTDFSDIELLNSELKKGNPLTLENFTRLEFDSTRVQYLVHGTDKKRDIEIKKDVFKKGYKDYFHKDSIENLNSERYLEYLAYSDYINSLPEVYYSDYFLYKRNNSETALCGVAHSVCAYIIACFYQTDGSLVFDSLPNPIKMVGSVGCPDGMESSIPFSTPKLYKQGVLDVKSYKINGISATKSSSNIVIQNKQPRLRLKGK